MYSLSVSQPPIGKTWVLIRAATLRPVEFSVGLGDGEIIDAGNAVTHQSVWLEFPVLGSVGAESLTGVVMPLVSEADGKSVVRKGPEFFDETIFQFTRPLACEKGDYGLATLKKFGAVAPLAVGRVGKRDPVKVTTVPTSFRQADFLGGGFSGERRQWRTCVVLAHDHVLGTDTSPPLLLLEESFIGLDLIVKESILDEIAALARKTGLTLILVSHDPWEVSALCRRAVVMEEGILAEDFDLAQPTLAPVSRTLRAMW